MNDTLFRSVMESGKATKKWLFFPMSLILHGLVLATLLVGPYISAMDSLPEARIFTVTLSAPPLPPTVPAGRPARGSQKSARKPDSDKPKPVLQSPSHLLIAPVIIPTEVEEEPVLSNSDFGFGEGAVDGSLTEGGDLGGIIGGLDYGKGAGLGGTESLRLSTVSKPKLIRRVEPNYPQVALRSRIQGTVLLEAATDIKGYVARVNVINGHPLLSPAAVEAVRKWVYEPYIINGYPKPVIFTVSVQFRLD